MVEKNLVVEKAPVAEMKAPREAVSTSRTKSKHYFASPVMRGFLLVGSFDEGNQATVKGNPKNGSDFFVVGLNL